MAGKKKYSEINHSLNKALDKHGTLIEVHRGSSGGNIVENTIAAYDAAIQQGGDMLEIDVVKSTDGVFYTFHDGEEKRLLNESDNLNTMTSEEIEKLTYYNPSSKETHQKIELLEDVLSHFKGDVLINIDRAWNFFPQLVRMLDPLDMLDQIILKAPAKKEALQFFDRYEKKYMFMPIVKSLDQIENALIYENINLVGMELIVDSDPHPLFQNEVIEKLHDINLFVCANAINLDDVTVLFAGLDDDISIKNNPDLGWGRLINMKVDVIQTDWPSLLVPYRNSKNLNN